MEILSLHRKLRIATHGRGWFENSIPGALAFTDDPLTAQVSTIKAIHISELRTRINTLRTT